MMHSTLLGGRHCLLESFNCVNARVCGALLINVKEEDDAFFFFYTEGILVIGYIIIWAKVIPSYNTRG